MSLRLWELERDGTEYIYERFEGDYVIKVRYKFIDNDLHYYDLGCKRWMKSHQYLGVLLERYFIKCEEPAEPKKIKLFRYTYDRGDDVIEQGSWSTYRWIATKELYKLLKTEEKEIEV